MDFGRFGVILFFLISGFVVPFSIKGERPLGRFAVSRFFRLYPAFWFALAVIAVQQWLLGHPASPAVMLANMTMAPTVFRMPWMNGIFWTLFIELIFYVIAGVLFLSGRMRSPSTVFLLGTVLLASTLLPAALRAQGLNVPVVYVGHHLSVLVIGLLVRLWSLERDRRSGLFALALIGMHLLTVHWLAEFSVARGNDFALFGPLPATTAYALAMALFLLAIRLRAPNSAILAFAGRISYSIYLLHWPIIAAVMLVLPFSGGLMDVAPICLMLVLTLAASWAAFELVEKPGIALGRRLLPVSRIEAAVV